MNESLDYSEVLGHEAAKRALQVAAAGNHGVLMVGPPGSGKTMLAQRFVTILPDLNKVQKIEAALVHSVAGEDISSCYRGGDLFGVRIIVLLRRG